MAGLAANSLNGSPGASASTVKSTTLIPKMLGIISRMRRMTYCRLMRTAEPQLRPSRFLVPVLNVPGVVVPAAHVGVQLVGYGLDGMAGDHRDHDLVVDHHVVRLDEDRRPFDRI